MKNVSVRLENTRRNHYKFWSAVMNSRTVKVFWGRIGSWTQNKKFTFDSNEEAMDFLQRKLESKLRRGYINVSVTTDLLAA
jgi:predicted DNA-binding WGR domain protein